MNETRNESRGRHDARLVGLRKNHGMHEVTRVHDRHVTCGLGTSGRPRHRRRRGSLQMLRISECTHPGGPMDPPPEGEGAGLGLIRPVQAGHGNGVDRWVARPGRCPRTNARTRGIGAHQDRGSRPCRSAWLHQERCRCRSLRPGSRRERRNDPWIPPRPAAGRCVPGRAPGRTDTSTAPLRLKNLGYSSFERQQLSGRTRYDQRQKATEPEVTTGKSSLNGGFCPTPIILDLCCPKKPNTPSVP